MKHRMEFRISAYKRQMASFRTWLYRIATNKVIDYRKKYVPIAVDIDEIEVIEHYDFVEDGWKSVRF